MPVAAAPLVRTANAGRRESRWRSQATAAATAKVSAPTTAVEHVVVSRPDDDDEDERRVGEGGPREPRAREDPDERRRDEEGEPEVRRWLRRPRRVVEELSRGARQLILIRRRAEAQPGKPVRRGERIQADDGDRRQEGEDERRPQPRIPVGREHAHGGDRAEEHRQVDVRVHPGEVAGDAGRGRAVDQPALDVDREGVLEPENRARVLDGDVDVPLERDANRLPREQHESDERELRLDPSSTIAWTSAARSPERHTTRDTFSSHVNRPDARLGLRNGRPRRQAARRAIAGDRDPARLGP